MREMILAERRPSPRSRLAKLLPIQRAGLRGHLQAMDGLPVTIRLLDPPLHEFLPHESENQAEMAKELGVKPDDGQGRVARSSTRANPMLGHRGCRLGVTYPEIYEMQVRAILEAAMQRAKKGIKATPRS
jgi:pyruvate,orthophosphate dikinase